jgi:hypothetical protein
MKKEFVPYELAVKLKELGFNEPCFGYYLEDGTRVPASYSEKGTVYPSNTDLLPDWSAAPTYSQAFKWFREKHGLYSNIFPTAHGIFVWCVRWYVDELEKEILYKSSKDYEEAELACLQKLIEIVKEQ